MSLTEQMNHPFREESKKLLKRIFAHEIFPAVGRTEPIARADAIAVDAGEVAVPLEGIERIVDSGTFLRDTRKE